jgi:hypothetical protein
VSPRLPVPFTRPLTLTSAPSRAILACMQLMTVPESKIAEMRAELKAKHNGVADWNKARIQADKRRRQKIFCDIYAETASVTQAQRAAGVTRHAYLRWKDTDPDFCEMFNEAVEYLRFGLQSSVYVRAKGERARDEDGNPAVDADGMPIYRNGSDRLAIALLGLEKKDSNEPTGNVVSIEIVSPSQRKGITIDGDYETVRGALS